MVLRKIVHIGLFNAGKLKLNASKNMRFLGKRKPDQSVSRTENSTISKPTDIYILRFISLEIQICQCMQICHQKCQYMFRCQNDYVHSEYLYVDRKYIQ